MGGCSAKPFIFRLIDERDLITFSHTSARSNYCSSWLAAQPVPMCPRDAYDEEALGSSVTSRGTEKR